MNNYKILRRSFTKGDLYITNYEASQVYEDAYSKGLPIAKPDRPARLYYKYQTARKTDFVLGEHLFPVVSKRTRDLLKTRFDDPLEFHVVELFCIKSGEKDDSYSFMNILENIACLDWKRSIYEVIDDKLGPVTKLRIREDVLAHRHILRIAEIPSLILVSKKFQELCAEHDLLGMAYEDISMVRLY